MHFLHLLELPAQAAPAGGSGERGREQAVSGDAEQLVRSGR